MQRMRATYVSNSGLLIPHRFMGVLKSLIINVKTCFNVLRSTFTDLKVSYHIAISNMKNNVLFSLKTWKEEKNIDI